MASRWDVELDGAPHVVELSWDGTKIPSGFVSDGVDHPFPSGLRAAKTVTFDLAGHPASLTRTTVRPGFWARFKRAAVGDILGGTAGAVASLLVSWAHELVVDGTSRGSWVATTVGGQVSSWAFVEPGQPVPLPSPPARGAGLARPHDAPEVEGILPKAVAGRELALWSVRGENVLRLWGLPPARIADIRAKTAGMGVALDDLVQATAGRADTRRDPPSFVFGFRIPAPTRDLLGGYALRAAGFQREMQDRDLVQRQVGGKSVSVGVPNLMRQGSHERGQPYIYRAADLVFVTVTDSEAWAADAIAQLP